MMALFDMRSGARLAKNNFGRRIGRFLKCICPMAHGRGIRGERLAFKWRGIVIFKLFFSFNFSPY